MLAPRKIPPYTSTLPDVPAMTNQVVVRTWPAHSRACQNRQPVLLHSHPVYWSLTSLCHSNGHIETMPAREINPFTALTRNEMMGVLGLFCAHCLG